MASVFGFETGGTDFVVGGEEESESESDDASPYEALSISILENPEKDFVERRTRLLYFFKISNKPPLTTLESRPEK